MILTINAGPGSGKTYTITNAYDHVRGGHIPRYPTSPEQADIYQYLKDCLPAPKNNQPRSICYFSHTNAIKDALVSRLPAKTKVYTFAGAGLSQLIKLHGYTARDLNRLDKFIATILGKELQDLPYLDKLSWYAVKRLVNHYKVENLVPSEATFEYLKTKYSDLEGVPDDWEEKVRKLLLMSAHPNKSADYADMPWLAAKLIRRATYDVGFVDESQDLGGSTYALVRAMCHHLVFVGDKNQAINAFAGADEEMFNKVIANSDAVLPLKTTFRCPLNIIESANNLIPDSVLPGPNKARGDNHTITYTAFQSILSSLPPEKCLVLCRTNAPLLPIGLSLIKKGFPVEIADKDIGNKLITYIKSLKPGNLLGLKHKLESQLDIACQKRHPMARIMAEELISSVRYMSEGCKSLEELYTNIKLVTNSKSKTPILLSTIHKAKGLENHNIFIINPPIEHPLSMGHPIAERQELNLHFVALTRTKLNLYWVSLL